MAQGSSPTSHAALAPQCATEDQERTGPGLAERFAAVRRTTERLVRHLSPEDMTPQSMPETSPVKWHLAHTTWFFEEFVLARQPGYQAFDPSFRYLFNSYYLAVGDRLPRTDRGLITRPGVPEVLTYRAVVTELLLGMLDQAAEDESLARLVELGIHHEEQHQELILMDLKHLLSINLLDPVYVRRAPDDLHAEAPALGWESLSEGVVEIGHDGHGFAFDNELPRHRVWQQPAEVATRQVTNAEWMDFMDDGGYHRPDLWLSDGWAAVQERRWRAPGYWAPDGETWTTFTLSGRRPVVPAEPVCHVSFYEADAFARWAGARLPTEAEWERWALARPIAGLDPERAHPLPARQNTLADVWEWTASAYLPYPGFNPPGGAVGEYNGKFMNDQRVLRGSSAVTPAGHSRPTYRNFFPAHSRWVFTGLRLAQ